MYQISKKWRRGFFVVFSFLCLSLIYLFQNCSPHQGLQVDEDPVVEPTSVRLRITLPTGGTVTDDSKIMCGLMTSSCSASFEPRKSVRLTALPGPGGQFDGWGGDCSFAGTNHICVLVMAKSMVVSARFSGASVPSPSPVQTPSPSPIQTPSPSPVQTPSPSPVQTPSPSPVQTPSPSPVQTPSPSPVQTPSPSPIQTPSPSPTAVAPVTSVGVGGAHACAVKSGGLYCWGSNMVNGLGDGTSENRMSPVQVSGLPAGSGVSYVPRLSIYSSCALVSGGVKCWGQNTDGANGNGGYVSGYPCGGTGNVVASNGATSNSVPVWASGLGANSGVTALAMGAGDSACAVKNGAVLCWGNNSSGQLGDGTRTCHNTPQSVAGISSGATAVSGGNSFSCAVVSGGVMCWGANGNGQLGTYTGYCSAMGQECSLTPVWVSGLSAGSGVIKVASGLGHTCALLASGEVRCWGANSGGQLGDGSKDNRSYPVTAQGFGSGSGASFIAAGSGSTCAIKSNGSAWCWGANNYGQVGDGTTDDRTSPVEIIPANSGVTSISVDWASGVAGGSQGAKTWGTSMSGVLGTGQSVDSFVPIEINLP